MPQETYLEMVERHVREGQKHIARQAEIIEERRRLGFSTHSSEDLLKTFEATQALHCEHLERLRALQS